MNSLSTSVSGPDFPRLLFIHDYRPEARALADLIRQILQGWPVKNLAWWHCRETELYTNPDLVADSRHCFLLPGRLVPSVRLTNLKGVVLETFWVPMAAQHLEHTITAIKPDLVVALLYGWTIPVLAKVRWPAGVRTHFSLWDMPDTEGAQKSLGRLRSQHFLDLTYQLLKRAGSFDAISPALLSEIRTRTGRTDGVVIHSGFEPQHLQALGQSPGTSDSGILRLAYVGTIISEKDFLFLLTALKRIRTRLPQKVILEFFGGRGYRHREWFESEWMVEHSVFTDEELVAHLRRCDWGIVVMDAGGKDQRYSRFSFPNKIGTYMSAGVPVLGYGHPQSSLAQIMQKYRLGNFTATTKNNELEEFLMQSLRLLTPQAAFRQDILQCARLEFNAAALRAGLWQLWEVR